jgi:rRNA maturation endonuclease Nob1
MWVVCNNCEAHWDDEEELRCPVCGSTDCAPAVHEDDDLDEEEDPRQLRLPL